MRTAGAIYATAMANELCSFSGSGGVAADDIQGRDPSDHLNDPVDALRPEFTGVGWDALNGVGWDPITTLGRNGRALERITLITKLLTDDNTPSTHQLSPELISRFPPLKGVIHTETNQELLHYLTVFLPHFLLCYALGTELNGGWGGSGMRIALLRMQTSCDSFWISITRIGFAMGSHGARFDNLFFSAKLAEAVDLMYRTATAEPLPKPIYEGLSGELHIRKEKDSFRSKFPQMDRE